MQPAAHGQRREGARRNSPRRSHCPNLTPPGAKEHRSTRRPLPGPGARAPQRLRRDRLPRGSSAIAGCPQTRKGGGRRAAPPPARSPPQPARKPGPGPRRPCQACPNARGAWPVSSRRPLPGRRYVGRVLPHGTCSPRTKGPCQPCCSALPRGTCATLLLLCTCIRRRKHRALWELADHPHCQQPWVPRMRRQSTAETAQRACRA
mmetsp:Transcript_36600/g.101606  ORF Transcript_36600/g.101606 Transcript_36600/m.101606 type:complete len:205 (+) Transcript_36600:631-1245(+)